MLKNDLLKSFQYLNVLMFNEHIYPLRSFSSLDIIDWDFQIFSRFGHKVIAGTGISFHQYTSFDVLLNCPDESGFHFSSGLVLLRAY
ncbi:unnamed protein product [Caretta caretta]